MCRLLPPVVAFLLLTSNAGSSEVRTWTDETGNFQIEARLSGTEGGKIKLTKKDGQVLKIAPEKLSDADQEFLDKQLEAWRTKGASHTTWHIKAPQIRQGVENRPVWTATGGGHVYTNSYQSTYAYKTYAYQPVEAMLVDYKGSDVVLRDRSGQQRSFNYGAFGASDQKFLDECRLMEKEVGSLKDVDLPKSYSSTNPYCPEISTQLAGQYDLGNGQVLSFNPNGTVDDTQWGSGTWIYDEKEHRHHVHWATHDVYVRLTSKGNLHVKDEKGHTSTAPRVAPHPGGSPNAGAAP